ncbi:MAG: tyrosine-type recombinase/integrase [Solirubrobacterales bacterium]
MPGPIGRREVDEALVEGFVEWLEARGRSSYTRRTYGLGAAHFLRWLDDRDIEPGTVGRAAVVDYVAEFRAGPAAGEARAPRTVNHRVSVLAALFAFWAESDPGLWADRAAPVPPAHTTMAGSHGMPGRDAPVRGRPGDLRARVPRTVPRGVQPEVALALIEAAQSWRDRALLTLLWRSGQRIGEWSERHGRHGLLGLSLGDLDRRTGTVTVRLKGARDGHRVPVAEDFWPPFARYLGEERGLGEPGDPAWVALRKGRGRPLSYATFESQLRAISARVGVRVNAHMFRHALVQALVDVAGLKVAQEVLGHAHISTTAASYAPVDEAAMVSALARAADLASLAARKTGDAKEAGASGGGQRFAFAYDADTARELDALADHGREGKVPR